jgi:branched-chain amino acid transport system substrate-binding protein
MPKYSARQAPKWSGSPTPTPPPAMRERSRPGRRLTFWVACSAAVSAIALGLVAGGGVSTVLAKSHAAPILIGASTPLSGPNAYAGVDWLQGLELGIKKVNAGGGVLGRKFKIVTADNGCNPAGGATAADKLIADHPAVILGSVCSSATLATMPLVKTAHIVQLSDDSSDPLITQEAGVGGNPWEFRINLDSSMLAGGLASYIANKVDSLNNKTVYYIAEDDAFGQGGVSGYQAPLKKLGVTTAGVSYYTPGLGDFDPILSAVQAAKPGAVVMIMEPDDAATMVLQYRELGLHEPIFDGGGALSQEMFTALGTPSLANGIVGAFFWNAAEDKTFTDAYVNAYGTTPAPDSIGPYYDAFVLADAIKLAGSATPSAIRKGLEKVDLKEAWGTIKFDSHDQAHPNVAVQEAESGNIKLLKVVPSSGAY